MIAVLFSTMEYPHWLIVTGALLVVLGSVGLGLSRSAGAEAERPIADIEPTEKANEIEQGPPEFLSAQVRATRKAKLAEQTRDRWAKTR
jgi:hypothetical protein